MNRGFAKSVFASFRNSGNAANPSPKALATQGPRTIKCILLGSSDVPKSSLCTVYVWKEVIPEFVPAAFEVTNVDVLYDEQKVCLSILDTSGQDEHERIRQYSMTDADIIFMCISLQSQKSLAAVTTRFATEVKQSAPNAPVIFVAIDEGERLVSTAEARAVAALSRATTYVECVLTASSVSAVFDMAVRVSMTADEWSKELPKRCLNQELDLSSAPRLSQQPLFPLLLYDSITSLNLSRNNLESLSFSNLFLHRLRSLDLSRNRLRHLPEDLCLLSGLTSLDLSHNQLADVDLLGTLLNNCNNANPLSTSNPPLDSSTSPLSLSNSSTPNVALFRNLRELRLKDNRLQTLPILLHRLPLERLTFDKDTISGIPEEILKSTAENKCEELLAYLKSLAEREAKWNQVKVLLVGEENVGKTSIAKFLISGIPVSNNAQLLSTNGIEIQEWSANTSRGWRYVCSRCFHCIEGEASLKLKKGAPCPSCEKGVMQPDSVTFTVWDFGGQEVFYPTHTFFLSDRCIYLVVFNLTKVNEPRIEYWLKQINAVAKERPPIIMVGTHKDKLDDARVTAIMQHLNSKFSKPAYGRVRAFLPLSCLKKGGLDELRSAVIAMAQKHDILNNSVPAYYLTFKQLLLDLKEEFGAYVSFSTFQERAFRRGGISDQQQLLQALKFLHDTGLLVYFDVPEKNLRDLVTLDPKWLVDVMSSLITFRSNFVDRHTGILLVSNLRQIWKEYPPEIYPQLIGLLERFSIAYTLKFRDPPQLIIPCLLDEEQPRAAEAAVLWPAWSPLVGQDKIQFGRKWKMHFMPLGFFARLVVHVLYMQPQSFLLWRSGMIYQIATETQAVGPNRGTVQQMQQVRLRYDQKYNELTVDVRMPKTIIYQRNEGHLKTICDTVESILMGFYNNYFSSVERQIICTHCLNEMESHLSAASFPLLSVINAMKTVSLIECPLARKLLPLDTIAPDLALTDLPVVRMVHLGKVIGKGGFGLVWKASWRDHTVAVKELASSEHLDNPERVFQFMCFQKEVALMSFLRHPNVLMLLGIMLEPLRMVLEFAPLGDLYQHLHDASLSDSDFSWLLRIRIATDVARGMRYLHQLTPPIIHRDLRSPNIFMMAMQLDAPVLAKVADFGLAHRSALGVTQRLETWQWMPPECFSDQHIEYSETADVYSFGMVMWELAAREFPFKEFEKERWGGFEFKRRVGRKESPLRPSIRAHWPPSYVHLMQSCWAHDPRFRPSMYEVCQRLQKIAANVQAELSGTIPPPPPVVMPSYQPLSPASPPHSRPSSPPAIPLGISSSRSSDMNQLAYADVQFEKDILSENVSAGNSANPNNQHHCVTCMLAVGDVIYAGTLSGDILVFDQDGSLLTVRRTHSARVCGLVHLPEDSNLRQTQRIFSLADDRNFRIFEKARFVEVGSGVLPLPPPVAHVTVGSPVSSPPTSPSQSQGSSYSSPPSSNCGSAPGSAGNNNLVIPPNASNTSNASIPLSTVSSSSSSVTASHSHLHSTISATTVAPVQLGSGEQLERTVWISDRSGRVYIISTASLAVLRQFQVEEAVSCGCQDDDGVVYVGGEEGSLIKFDPSTARELNRKYRAHKSRVTCVLSHRSLIFSASADATVCIWDSKLDKALQRLVCHVSDVLAMCLINDSFLWTGGLGNYIVVWDLRKLPPSPVQPLEGHSDSICAIVAVSSRRVWSASQNGEIKSWLLPAEFSGTNITRENSNPSPGERDGGPLLSTSKRRVQSGNWAVLLRLQPQANQQISVHGSDSPGNSSPAISQSSSMSPATTPTPPRLLSDRSVGPPSLPALPKSTTAPILRSPQPVNVSQPQNIGAGPVSPGHSPNTSPRAPSLLTASLHAQSNSSPALLPSPAAPPKFGPILPPPAYPNHPAEKQPPRLSPPPGAVPRTQMLGSQRVGSPIREPPTKNSPSPPAAASASGPPVSPQRPSSLVPVPAPMPGFSPPAWVPGSSPPPPESSQPHHHQQTQPQPPPSSNASQRRPVSAAVMLPSPSAPSLGQQPPQQLPPRSLSPQHIPNSKRQDSGGNA